MADELEIITEEVIEDDAGQETAPPTIEDYARAKGWKPKEEWEEGRGEWRDANTFLDFTFDRNRDLSKDLKELRKTTETMAETQARIMRESADRIRAEERERLEALHTKAVDEGDHAAAARAVQGLVTVAQPKGDDEVARFTADNSWFNSDPGAQALAVATAGQIAQRGGSVPEQLAAAKEAVHKRFPEYAPAKAEAAPPAKVIEVAQPSGTAIAPKRSKTFHDLPREAQEAARHMVKQGLLKDTDGYVRQYFNKEGTVE